MKRPTNSRSSYRSSTRCSRRSGSNLVAGLEARGEYEIVVCDRLGSDQKWQNLAKREVAAIVPPDDLLYFLDNSASQIHAVFHLGAITSTTETDADLIVDTNFTLSQALWERCASHGTRFIYASSAATYGDGSAGFDDNASPEELAKLRPLNAYGWSKHLFDRRIARLIGGPARRPSQWAGLKFFNVYGPNEYHKGAMRSVIAQILPQIAAGKPARLFKSHRKDYQDGAQKRDFIWVGDCVDVLLWLYDNEEVSGLFNLGSGKARTFADLAKATFHALGKEPTIEYIDMPPTLRAKYQYFTEAKMDRLRAAGYTKPFTTLEDGVGHYVRDYLATADPYV
ncbi:MAG: ADP-glyceromanno-heptose 6-epimerase [Candidatus Eiseniibacteriota bacterium]